MLLCDLSGLMGCLSHQERGFSKKKPSRVTLNVLREFGVSRVRIVMKEGFPESVKNSVSMCSRKQEAFSVFKQSFALVGLFKKGLGVRVVRFFPRANEKSS
jgi:hypothetical protein